VATSCWSRLLAYSCINCLRVLPYVEAWAKNYRSQGLIVIGVHAPDFAFERNIDNVGAAVKRLGTSISQHTLRPVSVVVAPISCTITWWLTNGLPRQFMVIKANNRCLIRFHLLVPGGRWATVIVRPASLARRWSSHFHSFLCGPLLPPQSAVIVSRAAFR
jgi:thiol-disulfide isomerase/thioredoxin